jgi:hypothetical protein
MAAAYQSALRSTMDLGALCVLGGKTVWAVHVDCLVLNDGGGVLGAISAAARAALAATRIPKVRAPKGARGGGGLQWPPEQSLWRRGRSKAPPPPPNRRPPTLPTHRCPRCARWR